MSAYEDETRRLDARIERQVRRRMERHDRRRRNAALERKIAPWLFGGALLVFALGIVADYGFSGLIATIVGSAVIAFVVALAHL